MNLKRWRNLNVLALVLVAVSFVAFLQSRQIDAMYVEALSQGSPRKVYLTFDDGPSQYTDEILDILKKNNLKATFFVVGKEDKASKEHYKRIVAEGHTLAMHSYSHNYDEIYRSLDNYVTDLTKLSNLLYDTTGIRPTIYRFPGGSSNNVTKVPVKKLIHYLNSQNITYYDWNALSNDAIDKKLTAKQLNANILKDLKLHNPCIVLMHDLGDRHHTVEALQPLIDELNKMDCQILPIDKTCQAIQHVKNEDE